MYTAAVDCSDGIPPSKHAEAVEVLVAPILQAAVVSDGSALSWERLGPSAGAAPTPSGALACFWRRRLIFTDRQFLNVAHLASSCITRNPRNAHVVRIPCEMRQGLCSRSCGARTCSGLRSRERRHHCLSQGPLPVFFFASVCSHMPAYTPASSKDCVSRICIMTS